MTRLACMRLGSLLSRNPAALSDGHRLEIEEHRASCGSCRENASFDELLRDAARAIDRVPRATIERAIAGAFAQQPPRAVRAKRGGRWALAGGLAVVAAGVTLAMTVGRAGETLALDLAEDPARRADVEVLEVGAARSLAHATVSATSEAALTWQPGPRRVVLERGALRVEVTPNTGKSFVVATPTFEVIVLGTQFDVDLEGVRVHRGAVQIRGLGGEVIAAHVGVGETWLAAAPSSDADSPDDVNDSDDPDDEFELELSEDLASHEPASVWLERAEKQLRSQELGRARGSIRSALAASPTSRQQAEAHTLSAELALVSGNVDTAIRRYRRVATRFRRHPQGEAALFAAARLEANRGRLVVARELLLRYQSRYRNGRFAREVARKLDALGGR